MSKSWTIGARADCDLVVDLPRVSGRHCRLTRDGDGYVLEDLGSTNGTYLNGVRITERVRVARSDAITLGVTAPMPWPEEDASAGPVVFRIGRESDNDLAIDLPMVSGHHARVVWEGKPGEAWIEDLGSSNGTAVGSPDRKVERSAFSAADTIYLGTHALPASLLFAMVAPSLAPTLLLEGPELTVGRDPGCGCVLDLAMVSGRHARLYRSAGRVVIEDLGSSNGTFVNGRGIDGPVEVDAGDLIGLGSYTLILAVGAEADAGIPARGDTADILGLPAGLAADPASSGCDLDADVERGFAPPWSPAVLLMQAPVAAILIVGVLNAEAPNPATPEGLAAAANALATGLFALALAAIWFGLSSVVLGNVLDGDDLREGLGPGGAASLLGRLAGLAALVGVQCAECWGIVAFVAGLKGPGLPALGLLLLAAGVGIALGLLIVASAPRPAIAWATLPAAMLVLWLFGGGRQPLPEMSSWARAVSGALPSRWAFEGLLLLESDRDPRRAAADPAGDRDLAEAYFPAGTERMGPRAAAAAMAFMLVGLAGSATVIAGGAKPGS